MLTSAVRTGSINRTASYLILRYLYKVDLSEKEIRLVDGILFRMYFSHDVRAAAEQVVLLSLLFLFIINDAKHIARQSKGYSSIFGKSTSDPLDLS